MAQATEPHHWTRKPASPMARVEDIEQGSQVHIGITVAVVHVATVNALAADRQGRYSPNMLRRTGPPKRKTPMPRKAARTKKSTTAHRKQKRAERMEHNEETAEIRAAVFERAGGKCECDPGCRDTAEQMDHFILRRHGQSVQSCWMLSARHHLARTENKPSRLEWTERFYRHCLIHNYEAMAAEVLKTVAVLRLKAALPV